jgi:acetolactate synthase-1/2/3 large subunit
MAMSECDVLIALGARFDDRVTGKLDEFAVDAEIIHVDIDPTSIGKLVDVDYPIVGDIKNVLTDMLTIVKENIDASRYEKWRNLLSKYKQLHPLSYEDSDEVIKPQWAIQRVAQLLGDDVVITSDVGQHQMWAAMFYPFNNARQWINSGGLGTMGYGFPAALGVKKGRPDQTVINFTGDGSILMNMQELITASEFDIPVVNVILNNNYLGMVRQWQTFFYEKRHSQTDLSYGPDFVQLAQSCGGIGYNVESKEEFDKALKDAVEKKRVAFINVAVARMENVLPMVPAGGSLYNMMLEYKD